MIRKKTNHSISKKDRAFKVLVETREFPVDQFDHRAHIRLAFVYLAENDAAASVRLMRETLIELLKSAGIDPSKKYHETLTEAWILAVRHFMNHTEKTNCADEFIDKNAALLDPGIMASHYSADALFSETARKAFVEPNLEPIPRYTL